MPDIAARTD
jgi:hypothetical protein